MYGSSSPFSLGPSFALVDPVKVVSILAWIMFVIWLIYTLVATYHWLRYGHNSAVAIPALLTHFIVSLGLALFAVSGFSPA